MTKDGGFPLPTVIDPPETVCVQFNVPNDPGYTRAFWGALWLLGEWFNWQRDNDHKGRDAAAVWRRQWYEAAANFEGGQGCPMFDVRQDPDALCTLQKTTDGETWVDFADLRLCPPSVRMINGRLYYVHPGTGAITPMPETIDPNEPPEQPLPPARGTPPIGESNRCLASANAANTLKETYEAVRAELATTSNVFTLALGAFTVLGFFLLFPPSAIVLIPLVVGMLALGDLGANPFTTEDQETLTCILYCAASDNAGVVTFDIGAVKTALDAETSIPLLAISLIIDYIGGSGVNLAGATTAIVTYDCDECDELCPETWCHEFDFTTGEHGWGAWCDDCNTISTQVDGIGWQGGYFGTGTGRAPQAKIQITTDSSFTITKLEFEYVARNDWSADHPSNDIMRVRSSGNWIDYDELIVTSSAATRTRTRTFPDDTTAIHLVLEVLSGWNEGHGGANPPGAAIIPVVRIWGVGYNPFVTSNCE